MKILEGKKIAKGLIKHIKELGSIDGFVAVFIEEGDDVQKSFFSQKERVAKELGVEMRLYILPEGGNDEAREYIRKIVLVKRCKGALIQLPLKKRNGLYLANVIPQEKDIDILSSRAYGDFLQERGIIIPPAVRVLEYIFHKEGRHIEDFHTVAVVGQGRLVGRPVSAWISQHVSQCFCLDKGYKKELIKEADLVITATGSVGSLNPELLKEGAWVIDFGYGIKDGSIEGDIDMKKKYEHLGYLTPTPGGTGPLLVSALFENLYVMQKKTTYEKTLS